MKSTFSGAFLRTFCHATEDCDKVARAITNIASPVEIRTSKTTGVHGNPITILEAAITDAKGIEEVVGRLAIEDVRSLMDSLPKRLDEGCNIFFRLDKQRAYEGAAVLSSGDDVILVRLKVRAFPAKCEVAEREAMAFFEAHMEKRSGAA